MSFDNRWRLVPAVALLIGTAVAAPQAMADPDPCRTVTAADVSAAVGATVSPGKADGPDFDEDSKARTWVCRYTAGRMQVWIGVAEFASATAAAAAMKEMLKVAKDTPEGIPVADAPGIGDRSAWGANDDGALWVVQKGRRMLNVMAAGDVKDPPKLREPLRRLAAQGAARL